MSIHSLLVGINQYQGNPANLSGCLNDVNLIKQTLQSCYKVPDKNIQILLDGEAVKDNIIAYFKKYFFDLGKDDTFIFYFSGHGSQEPAAIEFKEIEVSSDLETLVCYDSRSEHGSDLADKELRYLIAKVTEKGAHAVIISDSCHSGGVSRGALNDRDSDIIYRQTSSRTSPRAWEDFIFYEEAEKRGLEKYINDFPMGKHVLFSGCRDSELSQEQEIAEIQERHGVFTYSLCKTLQSQPHSLSYNNLHGRVKQQTHRYNPRQTPLIESSLDADLSQLFLATERQAPELRVYYNADEDNWYLDAGIVHGINEGDQFSLLAKKDDTTVFPLLITQVTMLEPEKALLQQIENKQVKTTLSSLSQLDKYEIYTCLVLHKNLAKLKYALEGDNEGIEIIKNTIDSSVFIEENSKTPEYKITAKNNYYYVQSALEKNWKPLFKPCGDGIEYNSQHAKEALSQLEQIRRFQQKLAINNPAPSYLSECVDINIEYNDKITTNEDMLLTYSSNRPRIGVSISLNEQFDNPSNIYCALFIYDKATFKIKSLFANEKILKFPSIPNVIVRFGDKQIKTTSFYIDNALLSQGVTEANDVIKLIVSDKPFNPNLIEQDKIVLFDNNTMRGGANKSVDSLRSFFEQELQYINTRSSGDAGLDIADWYSRDVVITTKKLLQDVEITPNKEITLNDALSIKAHPALNVTLGFSSSSVQQGHKSDQSVKIPTPFRDASVSSPFNLINSEDSSADLSVLTISESSTKDADSEGLTGVNAEEPLVINIASTLTENEQIIPYTFDGELFIPLGFSRKADNGSIDIIIESLPASSANTEAASDKGILNSLKIYFQKVIYSKLGIDRDVSKLCLPIFEVNNKAQLAKYEDNLIVLKEKCNQAKTIAIFLHGIIGETNSFIHCINQTLESGETLADYYDLVLTFDYENLNTPVEEVALQLKEKLKDIGIEGSDDKKVDLIAHSMGGLVSRWFIEQEGGDKTINKLIMLGTPNGGSPLAHVSMGKLNFAKKWANSYLVLILNGFLSGPISSLMLAGFSKFINAIDNTLEQLKEDSNVLKKLSSSNEPSTAYYIISGDTKFAHSLEVENDLGLIGKLKGFYQDTFANLLFNEANDLTVAVSSMINLPDHWEKDALLLSVTCDHMSYFELALEELRQCVDDVQD